jgi:hypothetical protein
MKAKKPAANESIELPDDQVSPCVRIFLESLLNPADGRRFREAPMPFAPEGTQGAVAARLKDGAARP